MTAIKSGDDVKHRFNPNAIQVKPSNGLYFNAQSSIERLVG